MRSKFDKNEVNILNEIAEIILYNVKNEPCGKTIVDTIFIENLKKYKWYLREDGYVASSNYNGNYQFLHRLILSQTNINYIDHINRDRTDNRLENLRSVSSTENGMNKGIRSDNTSGKVGVHWDKTRLKWCAMIGYNHKRINLGSFNNFEDAVKAREEAEKQYFKDFRTINERAIKYDN